MGFDLSTAQPAGFDLSTATPVNSKAASAAPINPATDFGGNTLQFGPFDTHIPIGQGLQNFLAGAGKATADIGRGIGQWGAGILDTIDPRSQTLTGLVTGQKPQSRVDEWRQSVKDSRALDAPLMQTKAGKAGFFAGNVADALPAAWIPGANTLVGSAAIGAGLGALQPSTSSGETAANIGLGGATGPAGLLLGRGAGALYQGGKAALEPLFRGGQERIAARTLQAFAGGPQAAQQAATNIRASGANVLPGVQPTAAELADNAGVAQLERSLRNNPETLTALTQRNQANRGAMTSAIGQIAGTDAQRAAAVNARESAASPLYSAAKGVAVPADEQLNGLMARPSMSAAWARAQQLAAERGETLVQGQDIPVVGGPTLPKRNMVTPDATEDSLVQFLAKHPRGIDSAEASSQGLDPAGFRDATVGIRRAFRRGGMSFDEAAETLHQAGYPVADPQGNYSANVLLDRLDDELRGRPQYSLFNTRRMQEADLSQQPPPDLTALSQKAAQANPKAAQSILDSWNDDSPETIARVAQGLQGVIRDTPVYSGRAIQYLKMGLSDLANTGPQSGMGAHEVGAVRSTLSDLNGWISKNVPALRAADTAYARGSVPINQMDIGRELSNRLLPAITDFGNNTRLNATGFANAVRNGDDIAAAVTGNQRATLARTLSAPQLGTVRQIGEQLARRANADELGRVVGSNTAQNLASQNVMRQFLGPLGMPQSLAERAAQSTLGQTLMKPYQWTATVGEPRVMQRLTDAALNPQEAARLLQLARTNPRAARLIWERQGLMGPLANTVAFGGLMGSGNAPQQ